MKRQYRRVRDNPLGSQLTRNRTPSKVTSCLRLGQFGALPGSPPGRPDVKVTGLSLPNLCKPYLHSGLISSVVLWDAGLAL